MPRKPLIKSSVYPYHIFGRSNNKEHFYVPLDVVWDISTYLFEKVHQEYEAKLHTFVLMPNHYHILMSTPLKNIDQIMNYWVRELSKKINYRAGRINRVFGGRYKWCSIQDEIYHANAYKYIYQNPTRAFLSDKIETYPWSTIQFLKNNNIPKYLYDEDFCQLNHVIPMKIKDKLLWLNDFLLEKEQEVIRRALRRYIFQYPNKKKFYSVLRKFST
ncbi:transposase [bacterium]|nr:transposase [bacterium]